MTIWRAGMLAVCVDASAGDVGRPAPVALVKGRIYRVLWAGTSREGAPAIQVQESDIEAGGCWAADRFRPLNDAPDDATLIARIKRCKPARKPVEA